MKEIIVILLVFLVLTSGCTKQSVETDSALETTTSISESESVYEPEPPQDLIKYGIITEREKVCIQGSYRIIYLFGTGSMEPLFTKGHHLLIWKDFREANLQVGNIITFVNRDILPNGVVVHRIIERGHDSEGFHMITKGDANKEPDLEKVRMNQLDCEDCGIVVAVIY